MLKSEKFKEGKKELCKKYLELKRLEYIENLMKEPFFSSFEF